MPGWLQGLLREGTLGNEPRSMEELTAGGRKWGKVFQRRPSEIKVSLRYKNGLPLVLKVSVAQPPAPVTKLWFWLISKTDTQAAPSQSDLN